MTRQDSLPVLNDFIAEYSAATNSQPLVARSQIFVPTGYPDKIQVAPGLVLSKPDRFDYAPDIGVADRKIRALTASARAGNLAILNITIEPGAGKTLFLPFRFSEAKSLVVLPTVFDAWSAHTSNAAVSNIRVYGVSTSHSSNVTYTDSYHAAYLITTNAISDYTMVFVDESHSQEGVTSFMASVARPGQVYVRMTASPATTNARPKNSFPIAEERDVPNFSSLQHAAGYVAARREHRVLVLAPSPEGAQELSALVPDSRIMTAQSPPELLFELMSQQQDSALVIADSVCGKGINLTVDCVVDFGTVDTPSGSRNITKPEQLQRKHRAGRHRPGVYCCSFTATATGVTDNYSIFRSNLWLLMNGLPSNPCNFVDPSPHNLVKLLSSTVEPALLPLADTPLPSPVPVTPIIEQADDSSESGDSVSTGSRSGDEEPLVDYSKLVLDDQPEPLTPLDRDFTAPSWYSYYVEHQNHPTIYVADLVHEHRGISAAAVLVDNSLIIRKATNRRVQVIAPGEPMPQRRQITRVANQAATSTTNLTSWNKIKTSGTGLGMTMSSQASRGVKFGSVGYDLTSYNAGPRSPTTTLGRAKSIHGVADIPFDGVHLGGPLAIIRGTRISTKSRGVSYKAASVCGGFLTVTGVVLASGRDMHTALAPLHQDARAALHDTTTVSRAISATHYLSWVVTMPLDSVDLQSELQSLNSAGAWSIPPNNLVPTINLESEYDQSWVSVLTDRIRNKSALPPVVPRGGWYQVARKRRVSSDDVLDVALAFCDYPSYSTDEQQSVYRAWNVLAIKSAVVGGAGSDVYNDAQKLLVYMSGADRLNDL